VRELYNRDERDVEIITEKVLAAVMQSDDLAGALRPLVSNEVRNEMRRLVRSLERKVDLRPSTGEWVNPAMEARDKLLRESVWVPGPGGGHVAWGKLTIQQHQAVIRHYQIASAGFQMGIAKHMEAIQIIQQHPGALCLDDCSPRSHTEANNLTEEGAGNGNEPARSR
jgi:hypothetical protein